ncbi:hypothetical protein E2C01_001661 [Portunus trituberculatus]|uniref:Uncharacterized protein n=1 Tax=Portunus trituberculatus TaxID=210409 RepID=A0A5B7CHV9_PORTR|nr:hypothetical protein [Portunus trituberculatus]
MMRRWNLSASVWEQSSTLNMRQREAVGSGSAKIREDRVREGSRAHGTRGDTRSGGGRGRNGQDTRSTIHLSPRQRPGQVGRGMGLARGGSLR